MGLTLAMLVGPNSLALTLAQDGKTAWVIVSEAGAGTPEATAAARLQHYLQEVTGATFPLLPTAPAQGPCLWVGPTPAVRALLPDVDWQGLGSDGIVIRTVGPDLVLAGGQPRGTLYAVYHFLEAVVGCRWWSSNESTIPRRPTLVVGEQALVYVPPVLVRDILYRDVYKSPEFQVQQKLNGHYNGIPLEWGGHIAFIPDLVHTFYKLLPPERYFAEHPDWYSEVDGKRTASSGSQLCLTNEAMRAEVTRVLTERLRQDPAARLVSLSQNDSFGGNCQCANCRALDEREGSPAGSLITFVNAVAADLEKEFPQVLVETLAYNYSRPAPRQVRPRSNVLVRLVGGIGCCYEHPLDSEYSPRFRTAAREWSAVSPHLFFWDYVTNFSNYLVPHPNLQVLGPNLRFFVACRAQGIFEQGDSGSLSGDFVRLRAWLLAHLLWDPTLDDQALIQQFLAGYYGAAGPALGRYLALVQESFLRCDIRLSSSGSNLGYMDLETMNAATTLWDEAEQAVAGQLELLNRVQRERLPFDHLWLLRHALLKQAAAREGKPFLGPTDPEAAAEAFIARVRAGEEGHGGMYSEGLQFAAYEPRLRALVRPIPPGTPPPPECQGLAATDWVDVQDNAFNLVGAHAIDDPLASDRRAAEPGGPWGVQWPISGDLVRLWAGTWKVYAVVRVDSKAREGIAFDFGVYDYGTRSEPVINIRFDQIPDDQYHSYLAATVTLNYNQCLWVSKINAEHVCVDRIFLVPLKE